MGSLVGELDHATGSTSERADGGMVPAFRRLVQAVHMHVPVAAPRMASSLRHLAPSLPGERKTETKEIELPSRLQVDAKGGLKPEVTYYYKFVAGLGLE